MEGGKTDRLIEHEELRDIHQRIDSLQHETQNNHRDLTAKLHGLEVAVARGNRFPAGAWVAAIALAISIIGTGGVLYNKLETAQSHSTRALELIEKHLEQAPIHRQKVEDMSEKYVEWQAIIPLCEERVKNLEAKVVGKGPDGWHRADQQLYDKAIQAQLDGINNRLNQLEKKK